MFFCLSPPPPPCSIHIGIYISSPKVFHCISCLQFQVYQPFFLYCFNLPLNTFIVVFISDIVTFIIRSSIWVISYNFISLLKMCMFFSACLNSWNAVLTECSCPPVPSSGSFLCVFQLTVFFLFGNLGHIFLLLCILGDLWLGARHCKSYLIEWWVDICM